jgi:hypothetical protein
LKILVANYSLERPGGTQTWVKTVAAELAKCGHLLHVFANNGKYHQLSHYPRLQDGLVYDLGLINHNVCLSTLKAVPINFRIFTSHGIIPKLERPIAGADAYVGVSEEVVEFHGHPKGVLKHLANLIIRARGKQKYFPATVVRNPINTKEFKCLRPLNQQLTNVLFLSTHQRDALPVVQEACRGLNLKVRGTSVWATSVVEEINDADLVIGLGRTAYEAMACERNVIIYDYNGADGFATPENLIEFRKNNCSGRRYRQKLRPRDLKQLLDEYDPAIGPKLRRYVIENNDVRQIVQQYLSLVR